MLSQSLAPKTAAPTAEGINILPLELLHQAFRHLPTRTLLLTVCSVSRRFREASNTLLLHRLLSLSNKNGIFVFKLSTPTRRILASYRHFTLSGTSAPLIEGMDLSRVYGVYMPIVPTLTHTPNQNSDAPNRTVVVLEEGECFTQLCTDGLLWSNQNEMEESRSTRVFTHAVLRLRRGALRQMAKLGRRKVVWLDELGNVGLGIKVQARSGAWDNDDDGEGPVSYFVECEKVIIKCEYLVMLMEEQESGKTEVVIVRKL